ncbi:HlyC/CorC family transporter [Pokkaliibacter sp. CJK22405]|uniref:HlyC/CorC family transporter n=1 Tax=Pokkaliibacter sp. CJK22405 TaxID=3384615 RepID=UPI0039846B96
MNDIPIVALCIVLVILIIMSAFFSSSETGMMTLNRYRLRHLVKSKHRGAIRAQNLLERPERLIGVILIGNNFVNILASAIATVIATRLWGELGVAIATAALTFLILIFAEVTPKTLAALNPERVAFPASLILIPLLKLLYPCVWLVNSITSGILRMFRLQGSDEGGNHLSTEELRTVVNEAGALMPRRNQNMLLSILDLETVSVNDVMIPSNEIQGLDLDDELEDILQQIANSKYTRLPIYQGEINNVMGVLHMRSVAGLLNSTEPVTKELIIEQAFEPYFIPENTPLHTQLMNFQKANKRLGLVVDEYGDVIGAVTLEDILEEIVGELSTKEDIEDQDIVHQDDGSIIIDGTSTIRDINKSLHWELPTEGPKTINGLIVETLEAIPVANTCVQIDEYRFETLQIKDNLIKSVRAYKLKSDD